LIQSDTIEGLAPAKRGPDRPQRNQDRSKSIFATARNASHFARKRAGTQIAAPMLNEALEVISSHPAKRAVPSVTASHGEAVIGVRVLMSGRAASVVCTTMLP
jgi:hypothetical protein